MTHTERAAVRAAIRAERTKRRHAEQAARAEQYESERAERATPTEYAERASVSYARRTAELADRRREHRAALLGETHAAEAEALAVTHADALRAAADNAAKVKRERRRRDREQAVTDARRRSEWERVNALAPMTPLALLTLLADCAERLPASDDERNEVVAQMAARIGAKHGWEPSAAKVSRGYVTASMTRLLENARIRDLRRLDRDAWAAMAEADSDTADAKAARIRENVWSAFVAPPLIRSLSAAEVGADWLADALGIDDDDARLALTAGLSDQHRQAPALAAALGVSEAATRKRLERGRSALRERYRSATALTAALADVQAEAAAGEYVRLSAAERAAAELVDACKQRTYALTAARVLRSASVGNGRWNEGAPAVPANRRDWSDGLRAERASGFYAALGVAPLVVADAESERVAPRVALRRSAEYRSERLAGQGGESIRAAMLAAVPETAPSAARVIRFRAPSAAAPIGSVAEAVASAAAMRRSALAAVYRERLAGALRARARRVIRRRFIATVAAHRLGALLVR